MAPKRNYHLFVRLRLRKDRKKRNVWYSFFIFASIVFLVASNCSVVQCRWLEPAVCHSVSLFAVIKWSACEIGNYVKKNVLRSRWLCHSIFGHQFSRSDLAARWSFDCCFFFVFYCCLHRFFFWILLNASSLFEPIHLHKRLKWMICFNRFMQEGVLLFRKWAN